MSELNEGPGPDSFAVVASRLVAVLESRIAPALERIAEALGRAPSGPMSPDPHGLAVAEIRRAIREGELSLAGTLLSDLNIDFPDAAESPALAEELAEAGRVVIDDRRKRIDAARAANDPDAVL